MLAGPKHQRKRSVFIDPERKATHILKIQRRHNYLCSSAKQADWKRRSINIPKTQFEPTKTDHMTKPDLERYERFQEKKKRALSKQKEREQEREQTLLDIQKFDQGIEQENMRKDSYATTIKGDELNIFDIDGRFNSFDPSLMKTGQG